MNFKENILECMDQKTADGLMDSLDNKQTHAVLLNTRFWNDQDFLNLFPKVKKHPIVPHAFLFDKDIYDLGKTIYHELGYFYIQDPSAMVVSSLLDFKETDCVLDLCAAPGGKTVQAAIKMNNKGLIISNDISYPRAATITNNLERLGISNVVVCNNDFSLIYKDYVNTFDKIILDAPCSGSGMFRKNDQLINEWSINKVKKFSEIQKELIVIAYKMLKPGGILSYSTCSYSKEENEDVIEYLLSESDAQIMNFNNIGYVNPNKPIGIRLMPSIFEGEGQYICQIQKPGNNQPTPFTHSINKFSFLPKSIHNTSCFKVNDYYFSLGNEINFKGLKIIRKGLKVGQYSKNVFRYDLHFCRNCDKTDFPTIELTNKETQSYLSGEQIMLKNSHKGYVILTFKNNPIDIAKTDGEYIKNHYPKGLRRKYSI